MITSQAFSIGNFRSPLVRAWVERGAEVLAFAPDFDATTRETVTRLGARPVDFDLARASIDPLSDLISTLKLRRLLLEHHVDLTFCYFIKPVIFGGVAARLARVTQRFSMIEGAGYVFSDDRSGRRSWGKALLRRLVTSLYRCGLSQTSGVFFLNTEDLQLFCTQCWVPPDRADLIGPIGVEMECYSPTPAPTEPPTFLLAARLLEHKGVRDFVEASAVLRRRYPGVRCVLLGSPDVNPASVPEVDLVRWVSEGVVEWQPHVDDVRPWLQQASVLVLPSWYREGVPRSIQEAMAMGRAVITTDMPGCRDTVVDGESGLLIPPRDVGALVKAMERFVSAPTLIHDMGLAARRRAEACFDAAQTTERIISAMELALTSSPSQT